MKIKNWKNEIFSIPNMLSLFRLALIPVYVLIYLNARHSADYFLAASILTVSCITDLIDGRIARRFDMITTLGKILDPLADKATQFTLIVCLTTKHPVLWDVLMLFLIKEIFQLIAGGIKFRQGIILKGALLSGKICTTVLFCSLIILVLLPDLPLSTVKILSIINFIFLSNAFINYLYVYFKVDSKFQKINH